MKRIFIVIMPLVLILGIFDILLTLQKKNVRKKAQEPVKTQKTSIKTHDLKLKNTYEPDAGTERKDEVTENRYEYSFKTGKQFRENFEYTHNGKYTFYINIGKKEKKIYEKLVRMDVNCKGLMEITCYKEQNKIFFLGCKIQDPTIIFKGDGKTIPLTPELRKDFSKEIYFECNKRGEMKSIYFPKINGVVKNFWQQVFYLKFFVLPEKDTSTWIAKGENTLGTYIAKFSYEKKPKNQIAFNRKIMNYINLKFQSQNNFRANTSSSKLNNKKFNINKLKCNAEYIFDISKGFMKTSKAFEEGEVRVEQGMPLKLAYKAKFSSSLESSQSLDPKDLLEQLYEKLGGNSFASIKSKLSKSSPGDAALIEKKYTEKDKKKAVQDFEKILGDIRNIFKQSKWNSQKIADLFRKASRLANINPKILETMQQYLNGNDSLQVKGFLTDILADVGTQEAQKILQNVFTKAQGDSNLRSRAMFSTVFVQNPNENFRNAVVDSFKNSPSNSDLKGLSLRSLGAIAHKFQDGDSQIAKQMFKHIMEYKKDAVTDGEQLALLDALGNTHMEEAVPVLQEYLDPQKSDTVRATAIRLLAKLENDDALQIVNKALQSSPSNAMIEDTLNSFGQKDWSKHSKAQRNASLKSLDIILQQYSSNQQLYELIENLKQKIKKNREY